MTQDTHDTTDADGDSIMPTSRRRFLGTTLVAASALQGTRAGAASTGGVSSREGTSYAAVRQPTDGYGTGGYGAGPYGGSGDTDQPPVCPYTNANNVVETGGLRDAIDDWRVDAIDTSVLRAVIDAWRTSDPVTGC